ncbi:putative homoserine kinase type II (protein kinase fold) [Schinkia azotoformans MEV2011]|uniref:Putative homoserine kinase type II (Protein kinase fold) n=1 Tax=Schinkia azotoformans MEV2011 TaxID=1348973 RepID=A0A072NI41_SCHAZ|nr:phosphotransferase [Schinkia azotoformans]KEF36922.1 putative homoserine kinase type II (protein kinase fold) [Schinkia azotoformans MEV2011]MEC1695993.1 phosphotransferase [Schinkia azotoformans]MEC1724510.1 phosphotransferase [Schinkia azotoformans]MEC1773406.1 phosphotransferase [Schinkia azotoformans]MED4366097.1 phosphotransferase [Schinkia azotoformans]
MFEVEIIRLEGILIDFGIAAKVKSFTELQRYHYEKHEPQSKEVRLIIKVELNNQLPVVMRFKNETGVTLELIEEQSRFASLLLKNGIETPKQYSCGGNYAKWYSIGNYDVIVTVEQFVEGELHCIDTEIAEATGRLLANTHNIAERAGYHVHNDVLFDPLQENDLFSVAEFGRHKDRLMLLEPDLYKSIISQYEECLKRISVFRDEPRYAVQGDISDCNLYKTEDGTIGIFDFNRCGNNNLYFDAVMQAVFEARLMNYPDNYAGKSEELILPAFLSGYNCERPFSDMQKRIYPYLYAVINAFWSADIIWNDNSLRHSVEAGDKESISMWMKEIDRRINTLPEIPLVY